VAVNNIESDCKIDETGENVKLYYFCYLAYLTKMLLFDSLLVNLQFLLKLTKRS